MNRSSQRANLRQTVQWFAPAYAVIALMFGGAALATAARPAAGTHEALERAATSPAPAATQTAAAKGGVPHGAKGWPAHAEYANDYGRVGVEYTGQPFDPATHPFFKAMGSNGRSCSTCHTPQDAMSLSLKTIRARWAKSGARDPTFAAFDGSNCPSLDQKLESSHSLILNRGVFRMPMVWPPRAADGHKVEPEFEIEVVSDPTGCNTSPVYGLHSPDPHVSVFRRPRMVANFRYILTPMHESNTKTMLPLDRDPETGEHVSMTIMSDAREPTLKSQAWNASFGHLQAQRPPSKADLDRIVDFEKHLYVAQNYSKGAGRLDEPGGPKALGVKAMRDGRDHINGYDLDSGVFFFFDQWKTGTPRKGVTAQQIAFRQSVARGYDIFFYKPFWISDVVGINNIRLGNPYKQTCAFCHNTQMTGQDDVPGWMDLGTVNFPYVGAAPDLPVFKITCKPSVQPHPYLGRVIYTNDPGRALITGKCLDVGGLVMAQFRGMSARAPYFANGSAKSLREVVDFYDRRFNIGYTEQERQDLVNFLSVL